MFVLNDDYDNKTMLKTFMYFFKEKNDLVSIDLFMEKLDNTDVFKINEEFKWKSFEKILYTKECLYFLYDLMNLHIDLNINVNNNVFYKEKAESIYEFISKKINENIKLKSCLLNLMKKSFGEKQTVISNFINENMGINLKTIDLHNEIIELTQQFQDNINVIYKKDFVFINQKDLREKSMTKVEIAKAIKSAESIGVKNKLAFCADETNLRKLIPNLLKEVDRKRIYNKILKINRSGKNNNEVVLKKILHKKHDLAISENKKNYFSFISKDYFLNKENDVNKFYEIMYSDLYVFYETYKDEIKDEAIACGFESLDPWNFAYFKKNLELKNIIRSDSVDVFNVLNKIKTIMSNEMNCDIKQTYLNSNKKNPVWEIVDKNDGKNGFIIFDIFSNKVKSNGGYFCMDIKNNSTHLGQNSSTLSCVSGNFTDINTNKMGLYEIIALFHELGHAMQNFYSKNKYDTINKNNLPLDLVEVPSQLMEHYVCNEDILMKVFKTNSVEKNKKIKNNIKLWLEKNVGINNVGRVYDDIIVNKDKFNLFTKSYKIKSIDSQISKESQKNFNIYSDFYMGYGSDFDYGATAHVYLVNDILAWELYLLKNEKGLKMHEVFKKFLCLNSSVKTKDLMKKYLNLDNINSFMSFHKRDKGLAICKIR